MRTLKEAGFKMVLLTAKHHDGFCLRPTKTTAHSVFLHLGRMVKGWVKELRDACDKYDMKFGVYLSHRIEMRHAMGILRNITSFHSAIDRVAFNYGKCTRCGSMVPMVKGPNGKKQVYDWDAFYKTIQKLAN